MSEHETRTKIILGTSPEGLTYRATCSCGWRGLERWHQSHADADDHMRWIPGSHAYARDMRSFSERSLPALMSSYTRYPTYPT